MLATRITFPWADGEEYSFDLRLGEVRKLEAATGLGIARILRDLQADEWKVDHFRETILQGLLGAGMKIEQARPLVIKWVDQRPARESLLPAQAILLAWLNGAPQEKKTDEQLQTPASEPTTAPADSTLEQSTDPPQQ